MPDNFKIGIADDVEKRIKELQIGNPSELKAVFSAKIQFANKIEKIIHKLLEPFQTRFNEWFILNRHQVSDLRVLIEVISEFSEKLEIKCNIPETEDEL